MNEIARIIRERALNIVTCPRQYCGRQRFAPCSPICHLSSTEYREEVIRHQLAEAERRELLRELREKEVTGYATD